MAEKPELKQYKFYLDDETISIIRRFQRSGGFGSRGGSAALRFMVRDWEKIRETRFVITPAGRKALRNGG